MMPSRIRPTVRAIWRPTNILPSVVASLASLGFLIAAATTDQADPTVPIVGVLLMTTCAIGFTLDDDAAATLEASPTTLTRRRLIAASVGVFPILATWCFALILIDATWPARSIDVGDLITELVALAVLTLGVAARWGGIAGCVGTPSISALLTALAFRYDGIPALPLESAWNGRWSLVALVALAWLIWELRDPAAPRVRLGVKERTRVVEAQPAERANLRGGPNE